MWVNKNLFLFRKLLALKEWVCRLANILKGKTTITATMLPLYMDLLNRGVLEKDVEVQTYLRYEYFYIVEKFQKFYLCTSPSDYLVHNYPVLSLLSPCSSCQCIKNCSWISIDLHLKPSLISQFSTWSYSHWENIPSLLPLGPPQSGAKMKQPYTSSWCRYTNKPGLHFSSFVNYSYRIPMRP